MSAVRRLVRLLVDPTGAADVPVDQWSAILSVARVESLMATLACRLDGQPLPPAVAATLDAARAAAAQAQVHALWEAEMARRALAPLGIAPLLLKGTAFVAAGLPPAPGRQVGDLDILVARDRLDAAEAALLAAGWEWVKDDPYDQTYYRDHMHELPPLIHQARDRMIDVHHTILPLTARSRPDAAAMIAAAIPAAPSGDASGAMAALRILAPADMICHAAAHLIADGDLAGGLRNLWDIDRLLRHFSAADPGFWDALDARAAHHQLSRPVRRAARLAHFLYATPIPDDWRVRNTADPLFLVRLLARDDWGRETRPALRLAFYIRSHLMRMPPLKLLRHLAIKARRGRRAG